MAKKDKKKSTESTPRPVKRTKPEAAEETPEPVVDALTLPDGMPDEDAVSNGIAPLLEADPGMYGFFHRLLDAMERHVAVPAISEMCSCGAGLDISDSLPEPDRKRIHNAYLRRHKPCAPVAQVAAE